MQPRNTLLLQSAGKSLHCWQHLEKPFFSEELCLPHLLEDSGLVWQRKYTADMPECFITHCTWPGTDGTKTVMMSPVLGYVLCALLYSMFIVAMVILCASRALNSSGETSYLGSALYLDFILPFLLLPRNNLSYNSPNYSPLSFF